MARSNSNRAQAKVANVTADVPEVTEVAPVVEPTAPSPTEVIEESAPATPKFKVRALNYPMTRAARAAELRQDGMSLARIAAEFNCTTGQAAMALLVFDYGQSPDLELHNNHVELARRIHEDRMAKDSWGKLAARYGITELTARVAYEAHTGSKWNEIDLRRRDGGLVATPA